MAVSLTSGVLIAERKQGLLDRCLVAGIRQRTQSIKFIYLNDFLLFDRRTDERNFIRSIN